MPVYHLTNKVQIVWLVWTLHTMFNYGTFPWPWHGCKKCTSAQYNYPSTSTKHAYATQTRQYNWMIFSSPAVSTKINCLIGQSLNQWLWACHIWTCLTPNKPQNQWSCWHVFPTWWHNYKVTMLGDGCTGSNVSASQGGTGEGRWCFCTVQNNWAK